MSRFLPLLVLLVACERGDASRPPRSTEALAALPAATDVVVRVSLAELRGTPAWPLIEGLVAPEPVFGEIAATCGLRLVDVVDAITVAGDGKNPGFSLVLVEGRFTAAQAHDCFSRMMAADREAKVTVRVADGITELGAEGFPEKLHVAWLRDGAVLIPITSIFERAYLAGVLAGPRLGDGALADEVRAVQGSPVWVAAIGDESRGPPRAMEPLRHLTGPVPPRRARARLTLGGGLSGELRLGFASPAEATGAADAARAMLVEWGKDDKLRSFLAVVNATAIEAVGPDVTLRATVPASELEAMIDEIASGLLEPEE